MATPAARTMLLQNGKSSPLHLLRNRLLGALTSANIDTLFVSEPKSQPNNLISSPFFLGYRLRVDSAVSGKSSDINAVLNRRLGGVGEINSFEARRRVVDSESDGDYEEDDEKWEDENPSDLDDFEDILCESDDESDDDNQVPHE